MRIDWVSSFEEDWGQELIGLKRWMNNKGLDAIHLYYEGNALAEEHGIIISEKSPYLAISKINLNLKRWGHHPINHFLRAVINSKPIDLVGHSIYIFDKRSVGNAFMSAQLRGHYLSEGYFKIQDQYYYSNADGTYCSIKNLDELEAYNGGFQLFPPGAISLQQAPTGHKLIGNCLELSSK